MNKEEKDKILKELGGIDDFIYDELVHAFIDEIRGEVVNLRACSEAQDYLKCAKIAHNIKGSSANLRIYEISEAAKEFEDLIKADVKDHEKILKEINSLEEKLLRFEKDY